MRILRWSGLIVVLTAIAELFLLIFIARKIGPLPTLAWLLGAAFIGVALARSQGRKAWTELRAAVSRRESPTKHAADAGLIFVGGLLLILPGIITDVLGIVLLIPPTRRLVAAGIGYLLVRKVASSLSHGDETISVRSQRGPAAREEHQVIDSTVVSDESSSQPRRDPPIRP